MVTVISTVWTVVRLVLSVSCGIPTSLLLMKPSATGRMPVSRSLTITPMVLDSRCSTASFARLTTGITYCNQYINSCGNVDATKTAEIRYLRALEYYFLMDAFGNIPFSTNITDEPSYMTRKQAYDWIEKELLEVEPLLPDPSVKHSTDKGYLTADKGRRVDSPLSSFTSMLRSTQELLSGRKPRSMLRR
jgi:hypothetical protein